MKGFELASGQETGQEHLRKRGNGHDALHTVNTDEAIIIVASDGCRSGKHSEVGAKISVRLIADAILAELRTKRDSAPFSWDEPHRALLGQLHRLFMAMEGPKSDIIEHHFVSTLVCGIVTPEWSEFAGIGDGYVFVNGELIELGPFANNTPPYPIYALGKSEQALEPFRFQVVRHLATEDLQSFGVATDGLRYLLDAQEKNFPGSALTIGNVSQLWSNDLFFRNPDALRRFLAKVNMDKTEVDWANQRIIRHKGHLEDDLAVIVGRRKAPEETAS